jgi:hypothetical protein
VQVPRTWLFGMGNSRSSAFHNLIQYCGAISWWNVYYWALKTAVSTSGYNENEM